MDDPPIRTTDSMLAEIETGTAAEVFPEATSVAEDRRSWLGVIEVRPSPDPVGGGLITASPPGIIYHDPLDRILRESRGQGGSSTMQRGDLFQVTGPSGSGKTTFLLFLLMTTILPSSWSFQPPSVYSRDPLDVPLGGRNFHAALVYPRTHASPLPRLARAMHGHVERCLKEAVGVQVLVPVLQDEVERVVRDSLRRVRVVKVRPRWRDWALALRRLSLPHAAPAGGLAPADGNGNGDEEGLDLVICDGVGDAYWPERWMEEERASTANGASARKRPPGIRGAEDIGMREVFEGIGRLRKELGSVIVLSTQGFWHEKREGQTTTTTPFYSSHLPPPFPSPWSTRDQNFSTLLPKDPTFWPLNVELTMIGKQARMQLPAETLLVDALRGLANHRAAGAGEQKGGVAMYNGLIRVTEGRGRAGTRDGLGWTFEIEQEGFGAAPPSD